MSWFSSAVHSVTDLFAPKPNQSEVDALNAQTAAATAANATAAASAAAALKAQQDANLIAAQASLPTSDSESSRGASDDELRKRMQGQNGVGLPTQFGAAPVGFRLLSGQ